MSPPLAVALVLRDLVSTGAPVPEVEDDHWTGEPRVPSAMLGYAVASLDAAGEKRIADPVRRAVG